MASNIPPDQPINPSIPNLSQESITEEYVVINLKDVPQDPHVQKVNTLVQKELEKCVPRLAPTSQSSADALAQAFLREKIIDFYVNVESPPDNLREELKARLDALHKPEPFFTRAFKELTSLFSAKTSKISLPHLIARVNQLALEEKFLTSLIKPIQSKAGARLPTKSAEQKAIPPINIENISIVAKQIFDNLNTPPSSKAPKTSPLQNRVSSSPPEKTPPNVYPFSHKF